MKVTQKINPDRDEGGREVCSIEARSVGPAHTPSPAAELSVRNPT